MTPRYHRSTAIFIVLSVLQSRVSSFTIHRSTEAPDSNLAVKNDISAKGITNYHEQIPVTIETTVNYEQNATNETITSNPEKSTITNSPSSTKSQVTNTTQVTSPASSLPNYTNSQNEILENIKEQINTNNNTSKGIEPTSDNPFNKNNTSTKTTNVILASVNDTGGINATTTQTNVELKNESTVPEKEITVVQKTEANSASYSTQPVTKETTIDTTSRKIDIDSSSYPKTTMTQSSLKSTEDIDPVTLESTTNDQETTKDNMAEKFTGADSAVNATPYWKKYTVIDRKRFTTLPGVVTASSEVEDIFKSGSAQSITSLEKAKLPDVSTEVEDLVQSGSEQSTISLEKVFNLTSDPSPLVEVENKILALNKINRTDKLQQPKETTTVSSSELSNQTEIMMTSSTEVVAATTRFDVVTSKRAGFLDFSSRPVQTVSKGVQQAAPVTADTTTGDVLPTEVSRSDTSTYVGTPLKTTGTETRPIEELTTLQNTKADVQQTDNSMDILRVQTKIPARTTTETEKPEKSTSMPSHSQLAEDAINEELLKEESLSDYIDIKRQRNQVVREKGSSATKSLLPPGDKQPIPADTSIEDKLSVKPISARPSSGLYTVSPNYKPLKKIDVQPPKPFVRNPDDNSWRNESLSSLGIVFKANNSSKPFTQVLKNKTETEWNSLLEKYTKVGETAELRERLEKIAEQRKSKKKKINQFGETVYTDYEETTSSEKTSALPKNLPVTFTPPTTPKDIAPTTSTPSTEFGKKTVTMFDFESFKTEAETTSSKSKVIDAYEPEDDEPDYSLANIDLKKFMNPPKAKISVPTLPAVPVPFTEQPTVRTYLPDRKPTIQYFPPREKQKVVVNDYDTEFRNKVNSYTFKEIPNKSTHSSSPQAVVTLPTQQFTKNKYDSQQRPNDIIRRPDDINKNIYLTQPLPPIAVPVQPLSGYVVNEDGTYNRATYVIKHLRDFIEEVANADETPNSSATEIPIRGLTTAGIKTNREKKPPADYYDYETEYRKDVINKFVENFNQNRFKADFPVLYNTSVVHTNNDGREASSTAFMKRLYDDARAIQQAGKDSRRYDPNCDRTVELSPAYELHYFVPEEEEKEEFDPRALSSTPYGYRL